MDFVGFHILSVHTVVADVGVCQRNDLLAVARIGEDFLIASDSSVEHHFTHGGALRTNGIANKDRAVCERQDGGWETSLKRQKHWILRF